MSYEEHVHLTIFNLTNLIMMIRFMCQPAWVTECPNIWLNIIVRCVCEGVSGLDQHLKW